MKGDRPQGRPPQVSDPEPWPESVEGSDLLDSLSETFTRHLALPEGAADAMALWTVHCFGFDAFSVSPYLVFSSPEKRCGKTSALILIAALVPRRMMASNITPASVFRIIEACRPTLLIDEAETFLGRYEEFRGILNAGHTRDTAEVIRCVGKGFEPRSFSVWCPKALALIGKPSPTLEDRSILIRMRRRTRQESIEPFRRDRIWGELEHLRRKAKRWAGDNLSDLAARDPDVPDSLHDRAADNWRPLLSIADVAGGTWTERGRRSALLLSGINDDTGTGPGVELLSDLRILFSSSRTDRLSSESIVNALGEMEDRPWPDWSGGKQISKPQLARLLKPFGVRPTTLRIGGSTPKGYLLADLEDAFIRYLPPDPQQPQQTSNDAEFDSNTRRNTGTPVAVREMDGNPRHDCDVAGVAAPTPPLRGQGPTADSPTREDASAVGKQLL